MGIHGLIAVMILTTYCSGARILLYPRNSKSHLIYFGRLSAALSEEGHVTSLLIPSNAKPPRHLLQGVDIITFDVTDAVPYFSSRESSEQRVAAALAETLWGYFEAFRKIIYAKEAETTNECNSLFQNEQLIQQLADANFDFIVVDIVSSTCGFTLPYKLGVPHISFGIPFGLWMIGLPALPSFVPSLITEYSDHMTFQERLDNTFKSVLEYMLVNQTDYFTRTYVPERPTVTAVDLMKRSSLHFVLTDEIVSYPRPAMPNIVNMGDIMVRSAQPLADDLNNYMDTSKNGVILVSFGGYVDSLPPEITCRMVKGLSRLPQDVIWQMKQHDLQCAVPDNVKLMSWIPQNDLLAHPNAKLFISHCGLNSVIEAVNHAVPILGFPLNLDQPFNAKAVQTHGYGLRLDLKNFTEDELVETINTILTDGNFKERVTKASSILKHKPMSAGKRASFWINHVHQYGDDHLRTKALELNDIQFLMLDIFALVVAIFLVMTAIVICCFRMFCLTRYSRFSSKVNSKTKVE